MNLNFDYDSCSEEPLQYISVIQDIILDLQGKKKIHLLAMFITVPSKIQSLT